MFGLSHNSPPLPACDGIQYIRFMGLSHYSHQSTKGDEISRVVFIWIIESCIEGSFGREIVIINKCSRSFGIEETEKLY